MTSTNQNQTETETETETEIVTEFYQKITLNDVQLAGAYYPILIDLAKQSRCMTYGELVEQAKNRHPENDVVQSAIPVSAGRKLEVVRLFTRERGLPDVTSLIINKAGGECGNYYVEHFDPVKARAEVFAYDWSAVQPEFNLYVAGLAKTATPSKPRKDGFAPRKRLKESDASDLLYKYYQENKKNYPPSIRDKRAMLLNLLMDGVSPEDAFTQCVDKAIPK
jgi:hypothetical protein